MPVWKKKCKSNNPPDHFVQVKSKFESEFRRFSIPRPKRNDSLVGKIEIEEEEEWSYEAFRVLVKKLHRLEHIPFSLSYTDPSDGDLLPINNNDNFRLSLIRADPVLRVLVTRDGPDTCQLRGSVANVHARIPKVGKTSGSYVPSLMISYPINCRHVSAIIDSPHLPPSHHKVRLRKNENDGRPLGFYVRDGWNVKIGDDGESIRKGGVFVSRLIPGGLAHSTGLLLVNDEVIEVNGVFVGEGTKTLDQVTDMIVANAADLLITIRRPEETIIDPDQVTEEHGSTNTLPSTTKGTIDSIRSKKRAKLNDKRKRIQSSTFYLDESDNEEVLTYQ